MNSYIIEIKEILSKKISVQAETKSQAENIIRSKYWDRDIELNSNDCIESSVNCIQANEENNQPTLFD